MRGRPILQWFLFACLWCGLLFPILKITEVNQTSTSTDVAESSSPTEEGAAWLSVRFSDPPQTFAFKQAGRVVWDERDPSGTFFEKTVPLSPGVHGLELQLIARFAVTSTVASEIRFERSGSRPQSKIVWIESPADEIVHFEGSGHE